MRPLCCLPYSIALTLGTASTVLGIQAHAATDVMIPDYATNIVATDRHVILSGTIAGDSGRRTVTAKLATNGDIVWSRTLDKAGASDTLPMDLATDGGGHVYVAGYEAPLDGNDSKFLIVKYDSDGRTAWSTTYAGENGGWNAAKSIALGDNGDVVVTGQSAGENSADIVTVCYDAHGTLRWRARYDGAAKGFDKPTKALIDDSGAILVGGQSQNAKGDSDAIVLKYSAAGELLWEARYDGSHGFSERVNDMAIDEQNRVHITGAAENAAGNIEMITLSYDAAGHQRWLNRHASADGDNISTRLAVRDGQVYVAGTHRSRANDESALLSLKIDDNGTALWKKHYAEAGTTIFTTHIARVDDDDNLLVVASGNADSNARRAYLSLSYSADGELSWVNRYTDFNPSLHSAPAAIASTREGDLFIAGRIGDMDGRFSRVESHVITQIVRRSKVLAAASTDEALTVAQTPQAAK